MMIAARRIVVPALALALFVSAATACGKATGVPLTGDDGGPSPSGSDAATESGPAAGCPTTAPNAGDPCPTVGLVCNYTSEMSPCGTITCGDMGTWEGGFQKVGCPLPSGLECPTPDKPELVGSASPVSRTCTTDPDCVSVTFQTDCCGNSFAFGVDTKSAAAANEAAKTCSNAFPGCGCPEGPPVAETGMSDAGFGAKIVPYCDTNTSTCRTRYF